MAYKPVEFRVKSAAPMVMHSARLANPLDPLCREIARYTSKRKKTEDDYAAIAELEFLGGLYLCGPDGGTLEQLNYQEAVEQKATVCLPSHVIQATLLSAGKRRKRGPQIKIGTFCEGNFPLTYKGPKAVDKLFLDKNFVLTKTLPMGGRRILRTRPIFREWELKFTVQFQPEIINEADLRDTVKIAGLEVGLVEDRPVCGRFDVAA